jgi:hypothetical protein
VTRNVTVGAGYKITGDGTDLTVNDATKLPLAGGTLTGGLVVSSGNITATTGNFIGNGSQLTNLPASTTSVPVYTYIATSGTTRLNSTAMNNVYRLGGSRSFAFDGRVLNQYFTFIRSQVDLTSGISFYYSTLAYRIFQLNNTISYLNVAGGPSIAITYDWNGQQKIRSLYMVVASTDAAYSFDIIEIS